MRDRKRLLKLPTGGNFLTVQDICTILGRTKRRDDGSVQYLRHTIDDAIRSGQLRAYCTAHGSRKNSLVVHPDDLRRYLQEREYKPSRKP